MRRFTPLLAATLALCAGQALAASPSSTAGSSNMPATDAPMQSTTPSTSKTTPPPSSSDTVSPQSSSSSAAGAGSDTSATAGGGAGASTAASLSAGEPVKDNTGATIGAIQSLSTGANGQKMAVIRMGNDTFQAPADRLGADTGFATINMSQSQISAMLHPPAGGR